MQADFLQSFCYTNETFVLQYSAVTMNYQKFTALEVVSQEVIRLQSFAMVCLVSALGSSLFFLIGWWTLPLWLWGTLRSLPTIVEDITEPRMPRYWLVVDTWRAELTQVEVHRYRALYPLVQTFDQSR